MRLQAGVLLLLTWSLVALASWQASGYHVAVCKVTTSPAGTYSCAPDSFRVVTPGNDFVTRVLASTQDPAARLEAIGAGAAGSSGEDQWVATLNYQDTAKTTGWSSLDLLTRKQVADVDQMFAAGFLEGFVTREAMTNSYIAANQSKFESQPATAYGKLVDFMRQQQTFTHELLTPQSIADDPFIAALALVDAQTRGVRVGYAAGLATEGKQVEWDTMLWNQRGEMKDILSSLLPETQRNCWDMTLSESEVYQQEATHCSSFGRPIVGADGKADFAMAHNTWDDFRSMLRIWKVYRLALQLPNSPQAAQLRAQLAVRSRRAGATDAAHLRAHDWVPERAEAGAEAGADAAGGATVISMSSYPGMTHSMDDWFQLARPEQRLVVTETTNSICDRSLYGLITSRSLMTWQRTAVANLLAGSGEVWTKLFARLNSGTYNNQYMVYDTKLFPSDVAAVPAAKAGPELPDDFLWIIEQFPGGTQSDTVTHLINSRGYWASFNRPYFPDVYTKMGFARAAATVGEYYSYNMNARNQIFGRDWNKGASIENVKTLMRYNDFRNDPLSQGNAGWAISARYDLLEVPQPAKTTNGATDCKITTARLMRPAPAPTAPATAAEAQETATGKPGFSADEAAALRKAWPGLRLPLAQSRRAPVAAAGPSSVTTLAISSPTYDTQPVFTWADHPTKLHPGYPEVYQFPWTTFTS